MPEFYILWFIHKSLYVSQALILLLHSFHHVVSITSLAITLITILDWVAPAADLKLHHSKVKTVRPNWLQKIFHSQHEVMPCFLTRLLCAIALRHSAVCCGMSEVISGAKTPSYFFSLDIYHELLLTSIFFHYVTMMNHAS